MEDIGNENDTEGILCDLIDPIHSLDYNPLVSDDLLESISACLPQLQSLSISNAGTDQSITTKGVEAVAKMEQLEQVMNSLLRRLGPCGWNAAFGCSEARSTRDRIACEE